VPVIPVAMIDTHKMMPTGRKIPHLRPRPGVRFGKPLDFSRYEGLENDRYILRSITDEIMYEIMELSGQEYVDIYASRAKALDKGSSSSGSGSGASGSSGSSPSSPEDPSQLRAS
jgi:1-acyl-sn-glycerol-3-phosphate acyltransferase